MYLITSIIITKIIFPIIKSSGGCHTETIRKNLHVTNRISNVENSFISDKNESVRFLSFDDENDLKQGIKDKCPIGISIGAVYNIKPRDKLAFAQSFHALTLVERELSFCIKMSPYDKIRVCCRGQNICVNCWPLMAIAIKVIDNELRDTFGFNHILWVYNGLDSVYCCVCDTRARRLDKEQRLAVVNHFELYKVYKNHKFEKLFSFEGQVHPSLERSYTIVEEIFRDFACKHKLLSNRREEILDMIPDRAIVNMLRDKCQRISDGDHAQWWKQLFQECLNSKVAETRNCVIKLVFSYTCPIFTALEENKHLLMAPFSVQPETARVCVPIDPKVCENFDPLSVLELFQLTDKSKSLMQDCKVYFEESFLDPLVKSCEDEREESYNAKFKN